MLHVNVGNYKVNQLQIYFSYASNYIPESYIKNIFLFLIRWVFYLRVDLRQQMYLETLDWEKSRWYYKSGDSSELSWQYLVVYVTSGNINLSYKLLILALLWTTYCCELLTYCCEQHHVNCWAISNFLEIYKKKLLE